MSERPPIPNVTMSMLEGAVRCVGEMMGVDTVFFSQDKISDMAYNVHVMLAEMQRVQTKRVTICAGSWKASDCAGDIVACSDFKHRCDVHADAFEAQQEYKR